MNVVLYDVTGRSASERSPSCAIIIWRDSGSPMPDPLFFVVKNGTNTSRATSGFIGQPSLLTSMSVWSSCCLRRMSMRCAPASTAFFVRFAITCRSMFSSARIVTSSSMSQLNLILAYMALMPPKNGLRLTSVMTAFWSCVILR